MEVIWQTGVVDDGGSRVKDEDLKLSHHVSSGTQKGV